MFDNIRICILAQSDGFESLVYLLFHLLHASEMGCIALRLGQRKVSGGGPAHKLPLAQAERYATHSTVLY